MAKGYEVLEMLIPSGGWVITGDDYEGIQFIEADPITKAEFEDGIAKVDEFKSKEAIEAKTAKEAAQAKLASLGLTADDLKALGF